MISSKLLRYPQAFDFTKDPQPRDFCLIQKLGYEKSVEPTRSARTLDQSAMPIHERHLQIDFALFNS